MAIVQISKIQVRSGNLVDLPQLDDGEMGWASDQNKLYIGKSTPTNENIEILTSYSNIDFSQLNGSVGNLDVLSPNTGQILTYVASSNTWVNAGGNALDPSNVSQYANNYVHLGDVDYVKLGGGAIGYVLETDGTGNLNWSPKGTLYSNIADLTPDASNSFGILANVVIMQVEATTPYVNGSAVTITGVNGTSNSSINSQTFYLKLANDYPTSGNTILYTSSDLASANAFALGTLTYTNSPNAIATSQISAGGGGGAAGGTTYSVQYNSGGVPAGDANFTWNFLSQVLNVTGTETVTGNIVGGNINTSGQLVSTVATSTPPLAVSSTTRVANLNVAYANVTDFTNITTTTSGTSYIVTANAITGNVAEYANANLTFDAASGTLTSTKLSATGNANVGNLGTTTAIITTINSGLLQNGNSNVTITSNGNVTITATSNATVIVTDTGANITGTLSASGNANVSNLGTAQVLASANVTAPQLISNVATGTAPLVVTSTTRVSNLNVSYANVSDYGAVTAQSTGNYYPTFVSASATGNRALAANASFSANLANGGFIATTFVGNLSGNITTTEITTGANTTQGNITGNWVLTAGSKMQATYADLAEYYEADQDYGPGTVLEFGGDKEVTMAQDGTAKVAGVVSTNPAYVMNAGCPGIAIPIALQGRVPCKVRGHVKKGDMMVSGGNGYARPWNNPSMGMVIGKALENFEGVEGIIEIAVGRL